jgi:nucleoside-diphosphate-sugar epimerase
LAKLQPDIVFHLAGITSRQAEANPSLGLAVNVTATLALLERLATRSDPGDTPPVFVHASSIGVFGTPLPASIDDDTIPAPTLSYGTHKRMIELLLADHARRGRIDGRAVRLPSVVARPRETSGALSSFASDLLSEPAAGRDYTCPIGPEGTLWLLSTPACIEALIHAARLPAHALPPSRCWTLPALRASAGEIVAALARRFGREAAQRVRWAPDPTLNAQFANWPPLHTPLADALGFRHDGDLDRMLRRALQDKPDTR